MNDKTLVFLNKQILLTVALSMYHFRNMCPSKFGMPGRTVKRLSDVNSVTDRMLESGTKFQKCVLLVKTEKDAASTS